VIKVGVIGLGMAVKPHMLSLRELETAGRVKFIGGFSPSAERRAAFARQWDAPVVERQEDLLAHADLVLILTPPWTHLPVADAVARVGKHMLIEKPLEATGERAEALAAVAEKAAVRCGVVL
jgi:UDP-N-acetyl-2-amino-2-deoxyglucuronate dehydrogenase